MTDRDRHPHPVFIALALLLVIAVIIIVAVIVLLPTTHPLSRQASATSTPRPSPAPVVLSGQSTPVPQQTPSALSNLAPRQTPSGQSTPTLSPTPVLSSVTELPVLTATAIRYASATSTGTISSGPSPTLTPSPAVSTSPTTTALSTVSATLTQAVPTETPTALIVSGIPGRVPLPPPTPQPQSWLGDRTLLTVYGRAFNTFPILGMLGMDASFAALEQQVQPYVQGLQAAEGGRPVRVALHLIYGLVDPCAKHPHGNCVNYLDDYLRPQGISLVHDYIEPAMRRGWLVVLDDQLGRSDPAQEMQRMIAKGYLAYDNVEVAFDPEFRTAPDQSIPGIPIGSVTAAELNHAQVLLSRYCVVHSCAHRKLIIVHQFTLDMITQREALRNDIPNIDVVIDADGFGSPEVKAGVYTQLVGPQIAATEVHWRAIKLFFPNPYETAGHGDNPVMTWQQVLSLTPPPQVIIIA